MQTQETFKAGEKGVWLSIAAYVSLSLTKLLCGYFGHSDGLIADGLNNSTDVIASIAVLIGIKIAKKPPDKNHPYGHNRAETVASLIAAFIMVTVGLQVIVEGAKRLLASDNVLPDLFTGWVALSCAAVMFGVFLYNVRLAKKFNSQALKAVAKDNLSDALVSIGAFVGIAGSLIGFYWFDTVAAIVVGLIIIKTAYGIFKETVLELTDGFGTEELEEIRKTVISNPNIIDVKSLKARMHGNETFVDITIVTDQNLNVAESHEITEEIENMLLEKHRIRNAHIHIEPE